VNKPHKHAELIKAWADGAEIEVYNQIGDCWYSATVPLWDERNQYRIKPEPKKVLVYLYVNPEGEYAPCALPPENGVWPINAKWKHVKTFEYTEGE
jgi:hypothetical protein